MRHLSSRSALRRALELGALLLPMLLAVAAHRSLNELQAANQVTVQLAHVEQLASWLLFEVSEVSGEPELGAGDRDAIRAHLDELSDLVDKTAPALRSEDGARLQDSWRVGLLPLVHRTLEAGREGVSTDPPSAVLLERRTRELATLAGTLEQGALARSGRVSGRIRFEARLALVLLTIGGLGYGLDLRRRRTATRRLARMVGEDQVRDPSLRRVVDQTIERGAAARAESEALLDLSSRVQLLVDPGGRVLRRQGAWMDLPPIPADGEPGGTWLAWLHPDERAAGADALARLVRGEDRELRLRARCLRADSGIEHLDWRGRYDRERGVVFLVGEDAGPQVRGQLAQEQAAAQSRLLLDEAPGAICVVQDGRIAYANRCLAAGRGGADPKELVGQPFEVLMPPGLTGPRPDPATALRPGAGDVELGDLTLVGSDGAVRILSVVARAVPYLGRPAVFCVGWDVTESRRTRSELAVAERIGSVGLLAAGVAHEVNNPLSYLQDALSRLEDGPEDEEGHDLLDEAKAAAGAITQVVRSLDAFSGLDPAGELVPSSVVDALHAAARVARNTVQQRARLVESFEAVDLVRAPAGALAQVFLNLIVNAAQAIPGGDRAAHSVSVRCFQRGEDVVVEVQDDGAGINAEVRTRLFDPFFTTRAIGEGSGLGLAVCRGIVDRCGGRIEVESVEGLGSTFRVLLPACDDVSAMPGPSVPVLEDDSGTGPAVLLSPPSTPPPRRPDAAARPRLLVVDDDPRVARALARTLRRRYDVDLAHTGLEAKDQVQATAYDAIVCDLMMPDVSGDEVYDWLALHHPHLIDRLLMITGGAFTPQAQRFLASGVTPCLTKPIEAGALIAAVDHLLESARA